MTDWPPAARPFRANPPDGSVGIVLPIKDDLRFFKLCYHSLLAFTDYRFMLTVVDNMSGIQTRQYLESIRKNHTISVLQYQKDHNVAAEWNLGLRFMFSYSSVHYGVVMTPTLIVEPYWLSTMVAALESRAQAGAVTPITNGTTDNLLLFRRDVYDALGGFDERNAEPFEFIARTITDTKKEVPSLSAVYVHKFKVNGFDPRREDTFAKEIREVSHARS